MKKNQFAQKAGAARAVPILSQLCPQSFFLTQTNQYKSKLRILITCSFTTKARKTPLEPEQLKPLTHSQTKESFSKAASPAKAACAEAKPKAAYAEAKPKASVQPLVLDSLRLPQKKLTARPLKSGIGKIPFLPSKKKIKKETQNLRTIFEEANFSPLFSLQKEEYKKLVENQGLRAVWKAQVINSSVPAEKRKEAMQALAQLPKNPLHSPRLCILSGRSKGVYKKFRLSRHNMRSLLGQGILQGVKKASW
jgi:ribosomal protein S14